MKIISIIILLKLIQKAVSYSPGKVFVQLILYQNPAGKTDAGKDCDSWFHQFVSDKCDFVFKVCIKNANLKNDTSVCDVGSLSTLGHVFQNTHKVLFGDMIGFIPNPFNFSLNSMPENIRIGIGIYDDDIDGQELISQLDHAIQLPIVVDGDHSTVNRIVLSSRHSEMVFKIYGICEKNYYGLGCKQYCKPSFSRDGHYACDKVTGHKHCLIGWTGENCRQVDVCLVSNPCHGSSRCSTNDSLVSCECPPSLTGAFCEISKRPCDASPCVNGGLCIRNNVSSEHLTMTVSCVCPHNFTGQFCQHDVNECAILHHRCDNGGDCFNTAGSYYCVCGNNYWGVHCEKPPVYGVLGLDGSFLYKNMPPSVEHNLIVILLVVVVCLILIIVTLALLYLKKQRSSLKSTMQLSGSEASVYSQCHYEDVTGKEKGDDTSCPLEEDSYHNIYEQQFDDSLDKVDGSVKKDLFNPKCLSETVI